MRECDITVPPRKSLRWIDRIAQALRDRVDVGRNDPVASAAFAIEGDTANVA